MAIDISYLPAHSDAAAMAINNHVYREETRLSYRRTMWLLAWYYLNGARRFDLIDPVTGRLTPYYVDQEGNLEFQSQELVTAINRTAGKLASLDLSPRVVRTDNSLYGIRDRSTAQIIADSIISAQQLIDIKRDFSYLFTCMGSCGLSGKLVDHPTRGLTADLEVVHPKELFPFPSLGQDSTKCRGMVRQRVIPYAFLKKVIEPRKLARLLPLCRAWRVRPGEVMDSITDSAAPPSTNVYGTSATGGAVTPGDTDSDHYQVVVQIRETWLDGPLGTCARYLITSNTAALLDEDYSDKEVYCPVSFARFYDSGTFHGLGLFDVLYSISREFEKLMKSLFNNIRNNNRYRFLCLPSGMFNERTALRDIGSGLRVMTYETDPLNPDAKPMVIDPPDLSDIPGKTAAFATQNMDRLNTYRDLLSEKGRVDSATGLQFLDEQVQQAASNPSSGIVKAFGGVYRSLLMDARNSLLTSPRPIPVTRVTLDLAGAVIDGTTNTVSFTQNPLPDVGLLNITVEEASPRLGTAKKAEALNLYQQKLTDRDSFIVYALKEGMDFAMYMDPERASFETVVRNILLLYGDGQNPSPTKVILTPDSVKPNIQLMVLDSFLVDPRFAMASTTVQTHLINYRQQLMQWAQTVLPPGVPTPDDAALATMQSQQMMQLQQPGGQGAPSMNRQSQPRRHQPAGVSR